jgi:sulfate transport system ATP-binding protein
MSIVIRNLSKTFAGHRALDGVSLTVAEGELLALLGPSGCGKTTLLRLIAGLESADADGSIDHPDDSEPRVGFVFQHYALFRHMTVFENVAFGLRVRPRDTRPSKSVIADRVTALLKLVQLETHGSRYPNELSGGQRQRVALARALAVEPRVLLLDEPFGALDARVRVELRRWLRRLHDDIHVTSVLVTHDQEEALEVADRVVIMNAGRIEQIGTPDEVFHHPANEFVMRFLGSVNQFRGRVAGGPDGRVLVRPHELSVSLEPESHASFAAVVRRLHTAGPVVRLELERESGERIDAELPPERYSTLALAPGQPVFVTPRRVRMFGSEGAA